MNYYILVLTSVFALIFLAKLSSRGTKKLPPGPSPWPIIGNLHLLGAKPHVSLANLAKTYGPIMSLKIEEVDVSRLPYLQFIVKETLRMHPPSPLLVPRRVDQDVELCDYIIPKGSRVLVNVWAIGQDSTFWEDPLVFKPERFQSLELDLQGNFFELIPFGAGRRICPGLALALRMVPVMLGSMLNSFNWKLESGIEPKDLDMEEKFDLMILSKTHPLRAIPSPL